MENFDYIVSVKEDKEVREKLRERFKLYKEALKKYVKNNEIKLNEDEQKKISNKVEEISNKLMQIFNYYYANKIYKAYTEMHKMINENRNFLSIYSLYNTFLKYPLNRLYRGRTGDFTKNFKREDLFHIPFNERENAATCRFSIPGQPCLYLGQSIFTIWQELGKPRIEDLYISRFCVEDNIRILDLAITYKDLYKMNNLLSNKDILKKYLITNVLRIASSIKVVGQKERNFKSEYILPQLILQIIMGLEHSKKIDGIRYISVTGNDKNSHIYINYAFPAKFDIAYDIKFSRALSGVFKLSSPINLGLINMHNRIA